MNARHTARTIVSSERGAALVMTLLVLVIMTAFGLTLAALGMTEIAISSNWRDYSKSFYAAEAALESGVVALRDLLVTTPTPAQAQLDTLTATPPTLSDSRFTFGTYRISAATPTPNLQTFATGPYSGLFGRVQAFTIQALVNGQGGTRANLAQVVQHTRVPLFQFGIFYGEGVDLELRPGPGMTFSGKIFANSNIHIAAGSTLQLTDSGNVKTSVKSAGNIYRNIKSEADPSNYYHPKITDNTGVLRELNFDHKYQGFTPDTQWSASAWANQAMQTFGGRVQDSAMGVAPIRIQELFDPSDASNPNPPDPDVVAHRLIEMPQAGDPATLASARMYSQAGLRIVDGVATDKNGNALTLPANAVTTRTFWDAREGKTMTSYDLDVTIMRTNGALPCNGQLYVAGTNTASNPVVRLVNGSQLPSTDPCTGLEPRQPGLTVVSQNPVYIVGDYNTVAVPGFATHPPAAVLADAVTVLSNRWMPNNFDSKSSLPYRSNRVASDTTVNAAIAAGPSTESTMGNDNGKVNNLVRFLEDWTGQEFEYTGSLLALWHSRQATAPWRCCGPSSPYYYAPPDRKWGYDPLFDTAQPPGTPEGVIVTKGPWSQS